MALKGIKVVELAGLAPAPFCGAILADFGASVIRIDKVVSSTNLDCLGNGKQSVALNLKHKEGINLLREMAKDADVLLEPFRKGVMEKLGLGPSILLKDNPRLIYARLTGYGQKGSLSKNAGHDINYLALSGLLSLFGRHGENPIFPCNLAADFGGGGLTCALGILLALLERNSSGVGQVIDCSMVHGTAYLGSFLYRSQYLPIWGQDRGKNILDTGAHFYEVYKTKDGKFISVGALEPQFYTKLLQGLGFSEDEAPHMTNFEASKKLFASKFLEKTRDEWCEIFDTTDACVSPVLTLNEAQNHTHNIENNIFSGNNDFVPTPAPKLSRTPGIANGLKKSPKLGEHTISVLRNLGLSNNQIKKLEEENVIITHKQAKL